jgi:hypothetical protein
MMTSGRLHPAVLLLTVVVVLEGDRDRGTRPAQGTSAPVKVADTKFALGRGIYDRPVTETVTSATPGASILYTTDGSAPGPGNGVLVPAAGPERTAQVEIPIPRSTVLRAMAVKPGMAPTGIDTQTYILVGDVAAQDGQGLPASAPWGHAGPDWVMDPRVIDAVGSDALARSLRSVPSVAITMEWDDLFGAAGRGIYIAGEDVDKAVVMEWLVPAGVAGDDFDAAATLRIAGGSSTQRWRSDKLSMRLKFPRDLRADVFANGAAVSRFDTLVLDAGFNNHWHYGGASARTAQRTRTQFILDQYVADLQRAAGGYAPHGRAVFLYLNRVFWGLYILHERPDDDFAAAYLGGRKADYDVLRHRQSFVVAGTGAAYAELLAAANRDLRVPEHYRQVADRIDLDGFIRYILVNFYVGNSDWSAQNWYASFNRRSGSGRWRYHSWDAEWVLDSPHRDVTELRGRDVGGPKFLHSRLRENDEYRARFGVIARELLEEDGALSPARAAALYRTRADEVEGAVVAESARWGDNRRAEPYTIDDWRARRDYLLAEYFPARTGILRQQLLDDHLYAPGEGSAGPRQPVTGAPASPGPAPPASPR